MQLNWRQMVSLALVALGATQLVGALPAQAEDSAATVTGLQNAVHFRAGAGPAWNPAARGQAVATDDAVRTGAMSKAELTYGDGTIVRLASTSTLVVVEQEHRVFRLLLGKIWAKVTKRGRGMTVHTAAAVASITGTEFMLEVLPDQSAHLTVFEGTVMMFPLQTMPGGTSGTQGPTKAQEGESVTIRSNNGGGTESQTTKTGTTGDGGQSTTGGDQSTQTTGSGGGDNTTQGGGDKTTAGTGGGGDKSTQPTGTTTVATGTGNADKERRQELDMDVSFGQGSQHKTGPGAPISVSAGQGLVARPEVSLRPAFQVDQQMVRVQESQLVGSRMGVGTSPAGNRDTTATPGNSNTATARAPQPTGTAGTAGEADMTKTQLQNQRIDPKEVRGSPTTGTIQILIR